MFVKLNSAENLILALKFLFAYELQDGFINFKLYFNWWVSSLFSEMCALSKLWWFQTKSYLPELLHFVPMIGINGNF